MNLAEQLVVLLSRWWNRIITIVAGVLIAMILVAGGRDIYVASRKRKPNEESKIRMKEGVNLLGIGILGIVIVAITTIISERSDIGAVALAFSR